jgi:hypothetical protein
VIFIVIQTENAMEFVFFGSADLLGLYFDKARLLDFAGALVFISVRLYFWQNRVH